MSNETDEQAAARWAEISARGDEQEIAAFIAEMDARDAEREKRLTGPNILASTAEWYARQGIPVFPLAPGDKKPLLRNPHPAGSPERVTCRGECGKDGHGLHDATIDVEKVRAWWRASPQANIGVPTGATSGFDVVDVDGPDGFASLAELRDAGAIPPVIGKAWTPRGRHLYIPATGDGNTTAVLPGIDYRGLGGYVAVPPSRRPEGRYDWLEPLDLDAAKAARR